MSNLKYTFQNLFTLGVASGVAYLVYHTFADLKNQKPLPRESDGASEESEARKTESHLDDIFRWVICDSFWN